MGSLPVVRVSRLSRVIKSASSYGWTSSLERASSERGSNPRTYVEREFNLLRLSSRVLTSRFPKKGIQNGTSYSSDFYDDTTWEDGSDFCGLTTKRRVRRPTGFLRVAKFIGERMTKDDVHIKYKFLPIYTTTLAGIPSSSVRGCQQGSQ